MTNPKPIMSASYRAIFILAIFMIFFVFFAGAATKSKSSGFGIWVWGYTAWLMYKRRVSDLVSFYKFILWFDILAAIIGLSILTFSENNIGSYIGYSLGEAFFLFGLVISITYGLYKYFFNLANNISPDLPENHSDAHYWERVSEEIKNGQRIDSLWIRAFSDADGDTNKANARYIKLRVEQLKSTEPINPQSNPSAPKVKNNSTIITEVSLFFNSLPVISKLAIAVVILVFGYALIEEIRLKELGNKTISNSSVDDTKESFNKSNRSYNEAGWTQDSTGSKEIGPWLNYSPDGTRYCRYADGTIQRLYPPGVKPEFEKANPFCLGESTSSPQ